MTPAAPDPRPILAPGSAIVARTIEQPAPASRTVTLALAGGAILLGGGAGWAYVANNAQMETWRREDGVLAAPPPSGTTAADWLERQRANNERSRSIHRGDEVAVGLAVGASALVVTAVVTYLMGR